MPSKPPQIVEVPGYVGAPASLLVDCVRVDLAALRTNGDMAAALKEQDQSLERCNADKAALRELQPKETP